MLDTNIVSHAIRSPDDVAAARIADAEGVGLSISVVVLAELRFGMEKRGSNAQMARLGSLLKLLPVLPLGEHAAPHYARTRVALERRGKPIGGNDLLIAAHALSLGATLVTDDGDFSRVEGLAVENWLRD